jgi:hypothetical protein
MSLYSELLDRVSKGAKFKINLVDKTLKIDGNEIILEEWKKRGVLKRPKQAILHVFAPFM